MKLSIKTLFTAAAFALLATSVNAKTLKDGVLTVGTEGTYSPFSFYNDKNELTGFDVEIAQAVAEKLGLKIDYVTAPWDAMLAAFDAGKSDVVFNQVTITDSRKPKYNFSTPYTITHAVIITHKDNADIHSFSDLKGKKNASAATSNWGELAKSHGAELVTVDGFSKEAELVINKRADTILQDDVILLDYLKQRPNAPLKIAFTSEESNQQAALVKKDNTELLDQINKALAELKAEGKLKAISEKYFGKDITE
ncbi:amino acid ABC transporter substrate-binding protein [Lonepinella sp. BR2357]|uniref:amino acid ABC transporter substrate-binding protein n=1 Tax=Lonepinella sp. BR2357 TaxID=3434549 RepID=UPI003F6DCC05